MKKDKFKTKVKFLIHPENITMPGEPGDLFAYFPEMVADHNGNYTSYAHIGQHGSCSPAYAAESTPATPEQYADLKAELESIGYNLEII